MAINFDFLSPTDKPALVAVSTMEWLAMSQTVLGELGYKVHSAANHEDFINRYSAVQYQIVIVDELFSAATAPENLTLKSLQIMPMVQRRHSTILLLGNSFQTLNPMQAYHQSVHAVVHPSELLSLGQIVQKTVSDNDLFLRTYRDAQVRVAQGKE